MYIFYDRDRNRLKRENREDGSFVFKDEKFRRRINSNDFTENLDYDITEADEHSIYINNIQNGHNRQGEYPTYSEFVRALSEKEAGEPDRYNAYIANISEIHTRHPISL